MEAEVWKPIIGFEDRYVVSNYGAVKSLLTPNKRKGSVSKRTTPRLLKPRTTKYGYIKITLSKNKVLYFKLAHRLVAEVFIPNPSNKPEVNHINGVKEDNRVENLEWCTKSENVKHAFDSGLKIALMGDSCPSSILDSIKVISIFNSDKSNLDLAKEYGVSPMTISDIKTGRSWKSITNKKYKTSRKLTTDDVLYIFHSKMSHKELSDKFGVVRSHICSIQNKKKYLSILKNEKSSRNSSLS